MPRPTHLLCPITTDTFTAGTLYLIHSLTEDGEFAQIIEDTLTKRWVCIDYSSALDNRAFIPLTDPFPWWFNLLIYTIGLKNPISRLLLRYISNYRTNCYVTKCNKAIRS